MGYHHYIFSIDKSVVEEIKDMTIDELEARFSVTNGQPNGYFYHRDLPTEELYELGKYIEFAEEVRNCGTRLFTREDTHEALEDYDMYVVGKEGLHKIIEVFKGYVIKHYESLLVDDSEDDLWVDTPRTAEQKQKLYVEGKLRAWKRGIAIDLNEDSEVLTQSWTYEYSLFELVRILKSMDFENKTILFYG